MIGTLIGDLAAWTWEHEHEKFYPELISGNAQLSVYGHALLKAASRNVLYDKSIDVSPVGSPMDGIKYYGQWLMWQVVAAWVDDDTSTNNSAPIDMPKFYSVDKEEYYAKQYLSDIIKQLRRGATKTEVFNYVNRFNGLTKHWNWRSEEKDDSILCHVFRAWDSFYRGFDLTSSLHNAQKWSGDRHLVSILTGVIAGAMYGSDSMYLKKKYAGENNFTRYIASSLLPLGENNGYHHALIHEMHSCEKNRRMFFPKNDARTNVEWHKFTPVFNVFEDIVFSEEDRDKILRAFYTDWDNRYGFYLDNGWVYSYRSFILHGRFKLTSGEAGWRITELQTSGEMEYNMLVLAVNEALYSCRLSACKEYKELRGLSSLWFNLKYYNGEAEVPSKWDGTTKGQLWYGEMMFVTTHQDLEYWTNYAISIRKGLKGSKKKALSKFKDSEFGIRLYIETLFGKFNPYDDFKWVYEN